MCKELAKPIRIDCLSWFIPADCECFVRFRFQLWSGDDLMTESNRNTALSKVKWCWYLDSKRLFVFLVDLIVFDHSHIFVVVVSSYVYGTGDAGCDYMQFWFVSNLCLHAIFEWYARVSVIPVFAFECSGNIYELLIETNAPRWRLSDWFVSNYSYFLYVIVTCRLLSSVFIFDTK